jgi:hypothetical protein
LHACILDLKSDEIKRDPTHFSAISQRYQDIVQLLTEYIAKDLPEGIGAEELEKFKEIYLDSAFICRYRECYRYSRGFKSSIERDYHEKLHNKPLRCADPSCDFFARGFTSKSGLNKHNRKYHPTLEEKELPVFEPEKEPEPEDTASSAPQAPPPPLQPRLDPSPLLQFSTPEPQKPMRQTPKPREERMSKAKKGLPVHHCDVCPKVFLSLQHNRYQANASRSLHAMKASSMSSVPPQSNSADKSRRHKLSHQPPKFWCSWPGCSRGFYRSDLLARHNIQQWAALLLI